MVLEGWKQGACPNLVVMGCPPLTGGTTEPNRGLSLQPQFRRPRKGKGEEGGL